MTVTNTTPRADYVGNGSVSAYDFDFPVASTSELTVYTTDTAGAVTPLYLSTGFTAVLNADGSGTITLVAGNLTTDYLLAIVRASVLDQQTDFTARTVVTTANAQTSADRLARQLQEVNEKHKGSIRIHPSEDPDDFNMVLPPLADRALRTLGCDSDGNIMAGVSIGEASVSAFGETLIDDADAAAARVTLGGVIISVDTVAAMTALTGNDRVGTIIVRGRTTKGDGGGGEFYWDAASTATVNTGTIFASDAGGTGRFIRIYNAFVSASWFGTDSTGAAMQAAIDYVNGLGGGTVLCTYGATYTMTALPVVKANVMLDMNRATFNATLGTGNIYGVRLGNYAGIRNGTINVTSTGSPSSQFIFHAAISLGEANSNGGTVASPSLYSSVHDFLVEDMTLSTTRSYCPVIQGQGDIYNGVIRNITIPSSTYCSGVHLDWSDIGTGVSSSDIPGTRTSFNANTCYTTHPHNILIENINVGTLSVAVSGDLAAQMVRLSACYNITARNLTCVSVTGHAYLHTGGDLGFEFAPANIKPYACRGNTVEKVTVLLPTSSMSNGIVVDTLADNIYREQFLAAAYSPLMNPLMHGDVVVRDANVNGSLISGKYGIRIIQARGVRVIGGSVSKWDYGVWVDEFTQDITIDGVVVSGCRQDGILLGFSEVREDTERVTIRNCVSYGNGVSSTGYGIRVTRCRTAWLNNNVLGSDTESTQGVGILIAENSVITDINGFGNQCLGATVCAYYLPATTAPYYHDRIGSWDNNSSELSVPQGDIIAPQGTIPLRRIFSANRLIKEYISTDTAAPTVGHWKRGSFLWQKDATAASTVCRSVTTSGSFGTLNGLTNCATTNTSKDITVSLSARTATTVAGAYTAVVSSATDMRVGILCSIAGAVTDARIIAISGTTLTFNKPCKAATGAALTTAGLIEGEVISINTTTPIAGAVVMKITGSTVTLDTAASDTQAARTLSYTTPVFKTHATIAA